jgi:energy-converting hydrogenase Eha subunit A
MKQILIVIALVIFLNLINRSINDKNISYIITILFPLLIIYLSVSCIVIHLKNFIKIPSERELSPLKHVLGFIGCLFGLAFGLFILFRLITEYGS